MHCWRLALLLPLLAACAGPEYRWIKQGGDRAAFEKDRHYCVKYVNEEFNPYYDYGPVFGPRSYAGEAMHRDMAAEEMYRACMHGRGYKLIAIERKESSGK